MKKALLSLVTSFLITSSLMAQVPAYIPTDGLVGYWPFNGNANDESGNGNNGTVNGATLTTDRNGNENSAYSFDGLNSRINLSNSSTFSFGTSNFSISHWFYSTNMSGAHRHSLRNINNSNGKYFEISPENQINGLSSFGIHDGINYHEAFANNIDIDNGSWHFLVGIRQLNSISFYIDGILQNSVNIPIDVDLNNLNNLQVGSFYYQLGYGPVTHTIDDIAIYNRALSAEEVNALYTGVPYVPTVLGCTNTTACNYNAYVTQDDGSCTFPAQTYMNCAGACLNDANNNSICDEVETNLPSYLPANGLVAWYPFNGNANDESGNGNNGSVNGATLTADRNGNANSAYSFDGVSSKINLSQPINFSNNSFTVSLFCKASDFGNSQIEGYSYVFGSPLTEGTNDQGFRFATNSNLSTYSATIGDQLVNDYIIFGQQGLNFGWYNLTMVLDRQSSLFSFYINNNNIGSVPISENFGNTDSGILPSIGTFQLGNWIQHYFNGEIDDIAIYNRALTQEEITELYNGTTDNNSGNNNNTATTTVPAGISYQAIARNAQGTALANTAVQVKFTLITDSLSGTTEYVETHSSSTNSLGLFATAFGTGTAVAGTWAGINWTHSNKYLKVELDAGNGFVDLGTQQLLSSPFAIRAQSAATIENGALPVYSDNAAAIAGGLTIGKLYRTATGELKVVY